VLVDAVSRALEVLGESDVWVAEATALRMLAGQLDEHPEDTDLWREFRLGLKALREATDGGDIDDEAAELFARLGGAPVHDAANG
jgi:hypothetical protein